MKFNRRVHIVATLFLALFLFTTNAYANSLTTIAGDNGSVSPLGRIVGDSGTVTVAPGSLYQVDKVRLYEGTKVAANKLRGTFPDDCPADDGPFPKDCSYGGINITYAYDGVNVIFTYSGLGADYAMAASFGLAPVAGFVVDGASPPSGSEEPDVTVQFNDTSTNSPSALSWDFGDGGTSTSPNPLHTFTAAGTYPVTLKVYNNLGQETDSYPLDYIVKVPTIAYQASAGANGSITPSRGVIKPSGEVTVDEGQETTFTIAPDPLYRVADVVLDDSSVCIGVPDVTCEEITAVIFDKDDIADHDIAVTFEPIPITADFSATIPTAGITTADQIQFNNLSLGSQLTWTWEFVDEDGNIIDTSALQDPAYKFAQAGTYTVTLTVDNGAALPHSYSETYTVNANGSVVREGNSSSQGYVKLQDAYDEIVEAIETIKMQAGEPIDERLIFNRDVTVLLKGGYDDGFANDAGFTQIRGNIIISNGTVIVSKIIVGPEST